MHDRAGLTDEPAPAHHHVGCRHCPILPDFGSGLDLLASRKSTSRAAGVQLRRSGSAVLRTALLGELDAAAARMGRQQRLVFGGAEAVEQPAEEGLVEAAHKAGV